MGVISDDINAEAAIPAEEKAALISELEARFPDLVFKVLIDYHGAARTRGRVRVRRRFSFVYSQAKGRMLEVVEGVIE